MATIPRHAALLALVLVTPSCTPGRAAPEATRFSLHQKDKFQALYDSKGKMLRLLQDEDGDGRAEVVVVIGPKGKPERGEMDTDGDGIVDRWEHFDEDGVLARVETAPTR